MQTTILQLNLFEMYWTDNENESMINCIKFNTGNSYYNVCPKLVRPQIHEELNAFKNTSHKYSLLHKWLSVSTGAFQGSAVSVLSNFANSSTVHLPFLLCKQGKNWRLPNEGSNYKKWAVTVRLHYQLLYTDWSIETSFSQ